MTIIKRTCTNCTAFNPTPTGNDPACWNLVSFTEHRGTPQSVTHEPGPHDLCDEHQTQREDFDQTILIEEHRETGGTGAVLEVIHSFDATQKALRQAMTPTTKKGRAQ